MDWLIGIAPSDPAYTGKALTPIGRRRSSADRLRIFLNLSVDEFLRSFPNRENALNHSNGRAVRKRVTGHVAVFGIDAWRCMGLPAREFWETYLTPAAVFYLLPHPSGTNRLYNVSANRARLRRIFCRSLPLIHLTTGSSSRESSCPDRHGSHPASGSATGRT